MRILTILVFVLAATSLGGCVDDGVQQAGPYVADTETAVPTRPRPTAPTLAPPTPRPTPSIPVATGFLWFRSLYEVFEPPRLVACDDAHPVPPNQLTEFGLCVRYNVKGLLGVQRLEWVLFKDEAVFRSRGVWIDSGNVPTPAGLRHSLSFADIPPGTYRLVVSFDDIRAGESVVVVP